MATQADDILDLTDDEQLEPLPETETDDASEGDGEEEFVSFDGADEPAEPAIDTDLVKHLRQQIRERDKKLAQVAKPAPAEQPIEVGSRPTMEACEYDQERFDAELDAWDQRREAKRQQDARVEQQQRQQNETWEQVKSNYAAKKAALPYSDKDTVEASALEALSGQQQAMIAKLAPDPALFIYAAGKNPARLSELAAIDDPLVLAATIGRMGATLTVKKRQRAPEPEQIVRGGTVRSQTLTKQLDALEAKAARTNDRSEIAAFKLKHKSQL